MTRLAISVLPIYTFILTGIYRSLFLVGIYAIVQAVTGLGINVLLVCGFLLMLNYISMLTRSIGHSSKKHRFTKQYRGA